MPKVLTMRERQENALLKAVERGKAEKGIRSDRELSDILGMNVQTYRYHRRNKFEAVGPYRLGEMFRKLGITGRQLAVIFGVPFDNPKEDA